MISLFLRGNDLENMGSRFKNDDCEFSNEAELGHILYQNRESLNCGNLGSEILRDLSVTELAELAGEKFKTGFELGRPFFGFDRGQQRSKPGTFVFTSKYFELN